MAKSLVNLEGCTLFVLVTLSRATHIIIVISPLVVTEDEFREFFEGFGKLVDSVVMFDRETGRSRGFGFVTFEDPVSVSHFVKVRCHV